MTLHLWDIRNADVPQSQSHDTDGCDDPACLACNGLEDDLTSYPDGTRRKYEPGDLNAGEIGIQ